MTTPTITKDRLEQRFKLWDTNGDGVIDRSDFEAEAQQIVRAFGEDENTPHAAQVVTAFRQMWDYLSGQAGTSSMSLEQFKQVSLNQIISQGDAGFARVLRPTIQAIATLCDTDGDGRIDSREFGNWLRAIGADPSRATELFRRVDADSDGYLSVDELVKAVQDYHQGNLDVSLLGGA